MRWALIYLDTTIAFPNEQDEIVDYEGWKITIFKFDPNYWARAGIDTSVQGISHEGAWRLLAEYFTLVAWSDGARARFVAFSSGSHPFPYGRGPQLGVVASRFRG